jgi:hypothetical protein
MAAWRLAVAFRLACPVTDPDPAEQKQKSVNHFSRYE